MLQVYRVSSKMCSNVKDPEKLIQRLAGMDVSNSITDLNSHCEHESLIEGCIMPNALGFVQGGVHLREDLLFGASPHLLSGTKK